MVPRHGKFSEFFLDLEVCQGVFHGELVAEAEAVVVQAETQLHNGTLSGSVAKVAGVFGISHAHVFLCLTYLFGLLLQSNQHLVIVVADGCFFAPYRLPCFVEGVEGSSDEGEAAFQVFLAAKKLVSQTGRLHDCQRTLVQAVGGNAVNDSETQGEAAVGAVEAHCIGGHRRRCIMATGANYASRNEGE